MSELMESSLRLDGKTAFVIAVTALSNASSAAVVVPVGSREERSCAASAFPAVSSAVADVPISPKNVAIVARKSASAAVAVPEASRVATATSCAASFCKASGSDAPAGPYPAPL